VVYMTETDTTVSVADRGVGLGAAWAGAMPSSRRLILSIIPSIILTPYFALTPYPTPTGANQGELL
jgi:hypothetical protein